MTPAEGVKRAAQALSLLWPFAVIAAVFGAYVWLIRTGHTIWIKSVFSRQDSRSSRFRRSLL